MICGPITTDSLLVCHGLLYNTTFTHSVVKSNETAILQREVVLPPIQAAGHVLDAAVQRVHELNTNNPCSSFCPHCDIVGYRLLEAACTLAGDDAQIWRKMAERRRVFLQCRNARSMPPLHRFSFKMHTFKNGEVCPSVAWTAVHSKWLKCKSDGQQHLVIHRGMVKVTEALLPGIIAKAKVDQMHCSTASSAVLDIPELMQFSSYVQKTCSPLINPCTPLNATVDTLLTTAAPACVRRYHSTLEAGINGLKHFQRWHVALYLKACGCKQIDAERVLLHGVRNLCSTERVQKQKELQNHVKNWFASKHEREHTCTYIQHSNHLVCPHAELHDIEDSPSALCAKECNAECVNRPSQFAACKVKAVKTAKGDVK